MNDLINKFLKDKDSKNLFFPPASVIQIKELESQLKCVFPQDYKDFLLTTNGFDGFIGDNYAVFESVDKILESTNNCCAEFFPWAIFIGTNGNLEMFVIDKRTNPYSFGLLPYIGSENDFIPLGNSFKKFVQRLFDDTMFDK